MINQNALSPKILFSCFLASCLEIYDFAIFGFLSVSLHKNYLSFLDVGTATLVTYVFFAVGALFRPIGSLIFGYIGDVYGRKTALVSSVSLMGLASFTMCVLPSYEMIGLWSCGLIILIRIVHGISVGGEFTGAIIFAVEHSRQNKAAFVASIVGAGGACGVLLANIMGKMLQNPSLPSYSWRFAFLIGFSLAIVGYFIRKQLSDTPMFEKTKKYRMPLLEGLKNYKTECFGAFAVAAANGTVFYFGTVYLMQLMSNIHKGFDFSFIPIIVGSTTAICLPIFGIISDRINRKLFLIISSIFMGFYVIFSLKLMSNTEDMNFIKLLSLGYGVFAAMMIASVNVFAIEIFPVAFRMSCASLFYSLGMGFIGGTVPMVSSYIVTHFGNSAFYISSYIACICILGAIGTFIVMRKQKLTNPQML